MNERLNSMWAEINKRFFNDELKPLALIDWDEIGGDEGLNAHGFYEKRGRGIYIDDEFEFDEDRVISGDAKEHAKVEASYLILLHEMIHQALHERGDPNFGQHQQPFLDEAVRIAAIMKVEPPTLDAVNQWPRLEALLFIIRGLGE